MGSLLEHFGITLGGLITTAVCWRLVFQTFPVCVFVLLSSVEKEAQTQRGLGIAMSLPLPFVGKWSCISRIHTRVRMSGNDPPIVACGIEQVRGLEQFPPVSDSMWPITCSVQCRK